MCVMRCLLYKRARDYIKKNVQINNIEESGNLVPVTSRKCLSNKGKEERDAGGSGEEKGRKKGRNADIYERVRARASVYIADNDILNAMRTHRYRICMYIEGIRRSLRSRSNAHFEFRASVVRSLF